MANDTKATPGPAASGGASTAPQPATLKQIRDAANGIVDKLDGMGREDQLRALEAATSMLGLRRRPGNNPNQQSGSPQGRGGSR